METIRGWKEKNVSLLAARRHPYHFLVPMLICRKTVPGGHDIVSLDSLKESYKNGSPLIPELLPFVESDAPKVPRKYTNEERPRLNATGTPKARQTINTMNSTATIFYSSPAFFLSKTSMSRITQMILSA